MDSIYIHFQLAHIEQSGPLLAETLSPEASVEDPNRLRSIVHSSTISSIQQDVRLGLLSHTNTKVRFTKAEGNTWVDVYIAYWKAIGEIVSAQDTTNPQWGGVYDAWKEVTNALIRGYSGPGFESWTIPCLYITGRYLRIFAIKADACARNTNRGITSTTLEDDIDADFSKNKNLEDAARLLNRIFNLCVSDRAAMLESRKWGLYYTANLLFKTYFKLNSITLSKNILRAIEVSKADMPPPEAFPRSHIVTFNYYVGVIMFLEENYEKAEESLNEAWKLCHRGAMRNRELILTYLIPCHLLNTHTLPTTLLLAPYPRLQTLFADLSTSIRRGDLAGFDSALAAGEDEFVKRRIYLTLERGRDIALRNLFRKVFLAGGMEEAKDSTQPVRRTRIPVDDFAVAIRLASRSQDEPLENDEVECLLANMIYKNLMKGYISRERSIVVLSKGSAFPGTKV